MSNARSTRPMAAALGLAFALFVALLTRTPTALAKTVKVEVIEVAARIRNSPRMARATQIKASSPPVAKTLSNKGLSI